MTPNPDRLKAKIRNLARDKGIRAQTIMQNYMFERFLERLSVSAYRDRFILKGGMLIAAMVGLDTRTTMDLDATIRSFPLDEAHVRAAIEEICAIDLGDEVRYRNIRIAPIRRDDPYGGHCVALEAVFGRIVNPMSIDITTGDAITPGAVRYAFRAMFDADKRIELWAYNIETVLAEKAESILARGVLNTRPRDFYDILILTRTQTYDEDLFREAFRATVQHRQSQARIEDALANVDALAQSEALQAQWQRYQREFAYAADIQYEDTLAALKRLIQAAT